MNSNMVHEIVKVLLIKQACLPRSLVCFTSTFVYQRGSNVRFGFMGIWVRSPISMYDDVH